MAPYKILLMGASYGSLLASKILFGGHSIHLVCLPAEADLINAEGFRVRMPIRGRATPVSALAVDGLVAVEECIDVLSIERERVAESPCKVHGARHVLAHDSCFDGIARRGAEGEDSMVAHEHRR